MCRLEDAQFRATSGAQQSFGVTAQEALAGLMTQSPAAGSMPIVIWPYNRGDAFFSQAQQARLEELKGRQDNLTSAEYTEWEALVEAAFDASIARTQTLPFVKS